LVFRGEESGAYARLGGVSTRRADNFLKMIKAGAVTYAGRLSRYPDLLFTCDGVGSKIELGLERNRLTGIFQDGLAMVFNDIVAAGGQPMGVLDYFGVGKITGPREKKIFGRARSLLRRYDVELLGGETAELPGLLGRKFDLVFFCVGKKILKFKKGKSGDEIIGLPSSGFHSNGYSLLRKLYPAASFGKRLRLGGRTEKTLDFLMRPTKIYPLEIFSKTAVLKNNLVGLAHVTGGGIVRASRRILQKRERAVLHHHAFRRSSLYAPVFHPLEGRISRRDSFLTFNQGFGFLLRIRRQYLQKALNALSKKGRKPVHLGYIESGKKEVILEER